MPFYNIKYIYSYFFQYHIVVVSDLFIVSLSVVINNVFARLVKSCALIVSLSLVVTPHLPG